MNTKGKTLIQVTSNVDGLQIGLYLVPADKINEFNIELTNAVNQNDFDENNEVGAERVFVDESSLNVQF